ncbi:hypothetical protein B4N89_27810 [Embleya scabrispora]|uniref:Uncharacterized protein n=1 Tax=Embleya scabrispora TaxID=159449 RepID=A0A1T3P565_9ACTN|nr:hypothetical protein [Embleya scabrispora]OPC84229.1 hypothetical protein B4N89_27810 [Embleya scabrispora]
MNTGTPVTYTWTVTYLGDTAAAPYTATVEAVEAVDGAANGWVRFRDASDDYVLMVRTCEIRSIRRGAPVTTPVAPGGAAPGEG